MDKDYKCEACGETFENEEGWTEEKRDQEMLSRIGDIPKVERATVCDDCYNKIMANFN